MMSLLNEKFSKLQVRESGKSVSKEPSQICNLVVVASTFMSEGFECVITWSDELKKLLRPVTNLKKNSWKFGTFQVGYEYQFAIVDFNPKEAVAPHSREDIIVTKEKKTPNNIDGNSICEPEMYERLNGLSKKSVSAVFAPGIIKERAYIIAKTVCPSVGILKCKLRDIVIYQDKGKIRCIVEEYDFPMVAQNRETLMKEFSTATRSKNEILVLLGLARSFTGSKEEPFDPPRCYIMVIGIIRAKMEQREKKETKC